MANIDHLKCQLLLMVWAYSLPVVGFAQQDSSWLPEFRVPDKVQADFLFHYYEQDGNHSAVTGGLGTEELRDIGTTIQVLVPLDSIARLTIASSLNHYTSASTDNIDSYLSSASRKDARVSMSMSYGQDRDSVAWSLGGGGSFESDYLSTSLSAGYVRRSPDGLREFGLQASLFLDTWVVIFPEELRVPGLASVPTDRRRSGHLAFTLVFPLHPRLQMTLAAEPTLQQGLLSTPFHRVYVAGELLPRIERLPMWRAKLPVSARLHYYASDWLVIRSFYRLYWDSFGMWGHTFQVEAPVHLFSFASLYPFYRFHWQSAAKWFAPYGQHDGSLPYYTSDFDLSGLSSQKAGVGLSLYPVYGLGRIRLGPGRVAVWEQLDLRYAHFFRSDGLRANSWSGGMRFSW